MKRIALIGVSLLGACAQAPTRADAPAVIVDPSAQSRSELHAAVREALSVDDVTLADDALTTSSILFIERAAIRGGRQLDGRDLGRPEKFTLFKSADQCVLVHERSGQRFTLKQTRCREES